MPTLAADAFAGTPRSMTITVGRDSIGWDYYKKNGLTAPWEDRKVIKPGYPGGGDEPVSAIVALCTTNVVIHYLTTNVPVNAVAPILKDTSIVNVMTEIEGGNIAIPDTWAKNYPDFTKRFGSDFSAALTKYTGKYDGAGNPLFVWQDYVAGTDPTDIYDVFTATITMIGGNPQVQWSPELVAKEAAKRVYTKYGKVQLQDEEWVKIPEGEEGKYNFFKVTVRMK